MTKACSGRTIFLETMRYSQIISNHEPLFNIPCFLPLGCRGPRYRSHHATHRRTFCRGWLSVSLLPNLRVANSDNQLVRLPCLSYREIRQLCAVCQISNRNFSQGRLLMEIKSGLSKDRFKQAIIDAIKAPSHPRSTISSDPLTLSAPSASESSSNLPTASGTDLDQNPTSSQTISPTLPPNSSTVQDLLRDRGRRLEAEKEEKDAVEKADQRAKAEIRRKAEFAAPGSARAKQASYAHQQRRRQNEERSERERIMREILNDKTARREKEERRRALVKAATGGTGEPDGLVDEQLSNEVGSTDSVPGKFCALQIRLFDGSTIRGRFAQNETIRDRVRAWIDKEGSDGDKPFTLKQILSPMPNRNISISDEDATLQSLDLIPSATLVKIPVQHVSNAYVADQGMVSRGISASYNVASAGVNMIAGLMGTVLGFGQTMPAVEEPTAQVIRDAEGVGTEVNIRSLGHQRPDRRDQQFYNGNQVCQINISKTDRD